MCELLTHPVSALTETGRNCPPFSLLLFLPPICFLFPCPSAYVQAHRQDIGTPCQAGRECSPGPACWTLIVGVRFQGPERRGLSFISHLPSDLSDDILRRIMSPGGVLVLCRDLYLVQLGTMRKWALQSQEEGKSQRWLPSAMCLVLALECGFTSFSLFLFLTCYVFHLLLQNRNTKITLWPTDKYTLQ